MPRPLNIELGGTGTNDGSTLRGGAYLSFSDFGAVGDGVTDDTAAFQAAFTAAEPGSTIFGAAGATYLLGSGGSAAFITQSSLTVDFLGAFVKTTVSGDNVLKICPQSLITSGRFAGSDYPSSWKNGSTPLPMDSTPDTMMHESTDANRVKNVTIRNANCSSSCASTFLVAYSCDGLTVENCDLQPAGWSALRFWHCSQINISNNILGGTGTYTVFLFKCATPTVTSNKFISTTANRALSCKGALHQDGVSIFDDFYNGITSYFRYYSGLFEGNTVYGGVDGSFWDTTPTYTEDAVGARGGTPIGFTSGSWYGRGSGFVFADNSYNLFNASPGTNGNTEGRAVWTSAPHQDVMVKDNEFFNSTIFHSGIVGLSIQDNYFHYDRGVGYAWLVQGDSVTSLDSTDFNISGNIVRGWIHKGTTVLATISGASNGTIRCNTVLSPDSSCTSAYGWMSNFSGVSDHVVFEENRVLYSAGTTAIGGFGANNPNGIASNNIAFNTSTGAVTDREGVISYDPGSGNAFTAISNGSFAGMMFQDSSKVLKTQIYYQDSDGTWNVYHAGSVRLAFTSGGVINIRNQTVGTTVGAAGGAAALPATPLKYITVQVDGTSMKIPAYNV